VGNRGGGGSQRGPATKPVSFAPLTPSEAMSANFQPPCIPGRLVTLSFRNRTTKKVDEHTVVYPWRWTKGNVLASARANHPESTVRISKWADYSADGSFKPTVWMVNPQKVLDYAINGKRMVRV
jgi:hypothetical protein